MLEVDEKLKSWFGLFGLDEGDLLVYLSLLQTGPSPTSSLSSKISMERNKVYRILLKLRNIGLVLTTFSNPIIFEANDIRSGLMYIIKKKESEVDSMKKVSELIIKKIDDKKSTSDMKKSHPLLLIIQGRSNIYAKISAILDAATKSIYIITTHTDIINMYYTSIPEKIRLCTNRGISVKILVDKISPTLLEILCNMNTREIRVGESSSKSRIVLETDKNLIMSDLIKESIDMNNTYDSILHTTSCEMINHMIEFSNYLWKKAKPFEKVMIN